MRTRQRDELRIASIGSLDCCKFSWSSRLWAISNTPCVLGGTCWGRTHRVSCVAERFRFVYVVFHSFPSVETSFSLQFYNEFCCSFILFLHVKQHWFSLFVFSTLPGSRPRRDLKSWGSHTHALFLYKRTPLAWSLCKVACKGEGIRNVTA